MSRFKRKNKVRILPLLLSLQLFIPHTLLAEESGSSSFQHWKRTAQVLNVVQSMGAQVLQAHQQRIMQQQAQANIMRMHQDLGIKQVNPAQVPPIITQNGCMVLEARTNKVNSDLSCAPPFSQELMMQGTYDALLIVSEQNANTLSNFLTPGHERFTTQGIGCYEKAENQLKQQLEARIELLDQMSESIKRRHEEFERLSRNDLMEVKKGQALLDGSSKDPTVQAALKDYRFEDQFKDPACRSFFTDKNFADMGKKGLRGIEQTLMERTSAMQPKKFLSQADNLEKEIVAFGKHLQTKQENNDGIELVKNPFSGFNNRFLPRNSAAVTKAMENSIDVINEENKKLERGLKSKIPTDDQLVAGMVQEISAGVRDGSVDVPFALSEFERKQKNKCLSDYMKNNFGSAGGFVGKLQDPNISRKANKEADSSFKNFIIEILEDDRLTVEAKKKRIAQAQADPANQRFGMVTGKSITVEGKNISASTRMPASAMVNMFVDNCVARFDSEPNSKGTTYRDIVTEMKSYSAKFSAMKQKIASRVASNVVNELIRCPNDQSTGVDPQTCDNNSLKSGGENFCLESAKKCAANINGCMEKAESLVKTTRDKQSKHVETYRANMNAFKAGLRTEFAAVSAGMERAARQLDGLFQMGTVYNIPTGLDLNMTEGAATLLSDIDPALELEDPAAYMKKAEQNIAKLKKTIEDQNKEVMKGYKDEVNKYLANYEKERKAAEKDAQECKARLNEHDQLMAQQEKEAAEGYAKQQEAIGEACKAFDDFRQNPCPSSGGSTGSLASDMAAIQGAISEDGRSRIADIVGSCESFGTASRFPSSNNGRNSEKYRVSLDDFCAEKGAGGEEAECRLYRVRKKAYNTAIEEEENGNGSISGGQLCSQIALLNASSGKKFCKVNIKDVSTPEIAELNSCDKPNAAAEFTSGDETKISLVGKAKYSDLDDGEKRTARTNNSNCSDNAESIDNNSAVAKFNKAKEAAMEILEQYRRNEATSAVGEVQVAACAGMNGGGEVDLTGDPMQQLMRGIAGGAPPTGAIGF